MVFGYDLYNDKRFANNHQSGSDFRILGTGPIVRGDNSHRAGVPRRRLDAHPWNPIPTGSQGTNFRTHSLFYNDNWRVNGHLTANLGLR